MFSLPLLALLGLPVLALLLRTPVGEILPTLNTPSAQAAVRLSLITSLTATILTIVFGTPVSYWLAHHPSRMKQWVDTLIDLPSVLPPSVAGLALLMTFGRRGLLGQYLEPLGITLAFTQAAVVLAQMFIAAPLYIKSAALGFSSVEAELQQAAALDGANPWQAFRFITVPLSWAALVGGAVMTWARALGEFGATIIFAGNFPGRTQTMPLAIYLGFELNLDAALTLAVILIGFASLALIVVKVVLHRDWR